MSCKPPVFPPNRIIREGAFTPPPARGACATCRYWGPWVPAQRAGECRAIRHTADELPRPHTARVQVDYEVGGYGGRLLTQPDFGCVQWAQKHDTSGTDTL